MSREIQMATKLLKYSPRVTWLCAWAKMPNKEHWVVSYEGVPVGEVFRTGEGRQYYGLIYDRDITEFPSGCIESKNFNVICYAVAGVAVNGST